MTEKQIIDLPILSPDDSDLVLVQTPAGVTGRYPRSSMLEGFRTTLDRFGVVGDGITDNWQAITDAITDSPDGARFVFDSGDYVVDDDLVIPRNITLEFLEDARVAMASGKALTIKGGIVAPATRLFNGAGSVAIRGPAQDILPQWWGALADGVADDSVAVQAAIDALPVAQIAWAGSIRPALGYTLLFPTLLHSDSDSAANNRYLMGSRVTIPAGVSLALMAPAPFTSRLVNASPSSEDYIFEVANSGEQLTLRSFTLKNLILEGGGVNLTSGSTGSTSQQPNNLIQYNQFFDTPGPAVRIGLRVVGGSILHNWFARTGGVVFDDKDSDFWQVMLNSFLYGRWNADIVCKSSGVMIAHNTFEQHEKNVNSVDMTENPHITILRGGNVSVVRNRFGAEVDPIPDTAPPRNVIVVGQTGEQLLGCRIEGNHFRGVNAGAPSHSGEAAIKLAGPPASVVVSNNEFWNYQQYVEETYFDTPADLQIAIGNQFRGNFFTSADWSPPGVPTQVEQRNLPRLAVFDHGGASFAGEFAAPPGQRSERNYISKLFDISGPEWNVTNLTVTRDQVGPRGILNSAFKLARIAGGLAAIDNLTVIAINGTYTISVWARAGNLIRMRLGILDSANKWLTPPAMVIQLDSTWRRYHVTALDVGSDYARLVVFVGEDGAPETSGYILIADPRVEAGESPGLLPELLPSPDIITASYNASVGELVRCDPTGGAFPVTLPQNAAPGDSVTVKNQSNSTTAINVTPQAPDTLDGGAIPIAIAAARGAMLLVSDGQGDWMIS